MLCEKCPSQTICKIYDEIKHHEPNIVLEVTRCKYNTNVPFLNDNATLHQQLIKTKKFERNKTQPLHTLQQKTVLQEKGTCSTCQSTDVILKKCEKCNKVICESCAFTEVDTTTGKETFICEECWEKN